MFNKDLQTQIDYLEQVLKKSRIVTEILKKAHELRLPNWYLGAGAIAQTVWSELHGYPLDQGIKDCDLVYYDASDISRKSEVAQEERCKQLFADLPVKVDVTNEAGVHLWYEQKFGRKIEQYMSTEDAINTWPTTATSIGVRYDNSVFRVYAPYGLHDLLNLIVRPNKTLISREVYEKKVERWQRMWPKLKILPWDVS